MSAVETGARARAVLDDLIRQRRRMEAERADAGLLEANRLGIVYWRLQLSRAQSAQHERTGEAA
jgi:hypothetical protein